MAIDTSLVSSSVLLGLLLIRRNKSLAGLFLLNIGVFVVAAVPRVSGVRFPMPLRFAADISWLNLFVATLAKHWRTIVSRDPRSVDLARM